MIYNRPESWMKKKVRIISFTIDGTSYQAEEGITWEQWCDSSYNTDGYYYRSSSDYIWGSDGEYVMIDDYGQTVKKYDTPVSGEAYYMEYF